MVLVDTKIQKPVLSSLCTTLVVLLVLSSLAPARTITFPWHVPHLTWTPSSDRFGRRAGMFMGGLIICIGTAVIATSAHVNQFIAGRFILGFGATFMTSAGPSYTIEIAPPQWRGKFTAFYNRKYISSIEWWITLTYFCQLVGLVAAFLHLLSSSAPRRSTATGHGVYP